MNSPKIGVTGATGFIGSSLVTELSKKNYPVLEVGRRRFDATNEFLKLDLTELTNISHQLDDIDVFIHCAGRAHVMDETLQNPLAAYLEFNTDSTIRLASLAAAAGVKRFIYLSSVKVLGESTPLDKPFSYDSPLTPQDDYGISKARAEEGLRDIAIKTGMECTIIRPPLVYGPGVKANFSAMMRLASRNLPLPFASIRNKRSMVALDNLVDLIVTCIIHEGAGNETFMVSDDADVSTSELLSAMTDAYGKKSRMLPCPPPMLSFGAALLGKRTLADRLLGSLQVDIGHTKQALDWMPSVKLEDVLKEMASDSLV